MNLFLGLLTGFIVSEIICGRTPGRTRFLKSLRFKYKGKIIHIHHWTWCAFGLLILFIAGIQNFFIAGFLMGALIQGITYKDSFQFVYEVSH